MQITERTRLTELEVQIEKDKKAFYRIGLALLEIRDSKLYRDDYATFEDYCRERWELGKAYAYRLIESANVQNILSPMGDIQPANERQARALTKLSSPEAQQEAWKQVVETAPEGVITARHVSDEKLIYKICISGAESKITPMQKKHLTKPKGILYPAPVMVNPMAWPGNQSIDWCTSTPISHGAFFVSCESPGGLCAGTFGFAGCQLAGFQPRATRLLFLASKKADFLPHFSTGGSL